MLINGYNYEAPAVASTWRTKYSSKKLPPGRVIAIANVVQGRCKAGREPVVVFTNSGNYYTIPLRLWYDKMELA
jgi:hypothetical protein